MKTEHVFQGAEFKSHMPFCDGETLMFCRSDRTVQKSFEHGGTFQQELRHSSRLRKRFEQAPQKSEISYRDWKLYYSPWKELKPQRLETGLPTDAVECSPAFFREDGQWHVSFTGGVPSRKKIEYRLYEMSGPSLDKLSAATAITRWPVRAGFVSRLHVCWARGPHLYLTSKTSKKELVIASSLMGIFRVSFAADQPERLIVTGFDEQHQIRTLIYQIDSQETFELSIEAYKPSLWGSHILFAERLADDFEDRTLRASRFEMKPSENVMQMTSSASR